MDSDDPKELDDPRYSMIQAIQWFQLVDDPSYLMDFDNPNSTVIPLSPMVLFLNNTLLDDCVWGNGPWFTNDCPYECLYW